MTAKRLLIIVSVLLVLSFASLLVYNYFFKTSLAPPKEEISDNLPDSSSAGNDNSTGQAALPGADSQNNRPSATSQKIKPVSKEQVLSPTLGEDGKTVKYYSRLTGHIWESDFSGNNLKEKYATTLSGLLKAIWSPDKTKVIGIFSDNDKIKKYFYDYEKNQSVLLSEKIAYVSWSPDSKKISYEFINSETGENYISTADPDAANWKNIFKTRLSDWIVEWPASAKISLRQPPSGLAQGLLYALNSATGDFNKILSDIYGLSVKWSPKADKILYSSTNDRGQNPHLTLTDANGAQTKDLQLSGLADKCVWSNDDRTIFCALPQKITTNAIWPDDYYKGLVVLSDDFYKINLETGDKTKILGSSDQAGYDAMELFLSPKEDYLFFVNKRDGLLWSLKLQ